MKYLKLEVKKVEDGFLVEVKIDEESGFHFKADYRFEIYKLTSFGFVTGDELSFCLREAMRELCLMARKRQ